MTGEFQGLSDMKSAEFLIAQYLRDPIRREAKNVGVIVRHENQCAGRFLGTRLASGEIDARTFRWSRHPDIYLQWLKYWTQEISKGGENIGKRLARTNGGNFDVIYGGMVAAGESPERLCDELFSLVISADDESLVATNRPQADTGVDHAN